MTPHAWELDPAKLMPEGDVERLLDTARTRADADRHRGRRTWPARLVQLELMACAGLRVSEVAALRVGDFRLSGEYPAVWVREGKARKATDKPEPVQLARRTVEVLREYISGLDDNGADAWMFPSRGSHVKKRAIQLGFKQALEAAELPTRYGPHSLRHHFGTTVYRATRDLRFAQKQLRHRSSKTTEVYADVLPVDIAAGMAKAFPDTYTSAGDVYHVQVEKKAAKKVPKRIGVKAEKGKGTRKR